MATFDQSNKDEDNIPPTRWVIPMAVVLIAFAISAVVIAIHIMAVPK